MLDSAQCAWLCRSAKRPACAAPRQARYANAPTVVVRGVFNPLDSNYDFNLVIGRTGAYSVVSQMWSRGGLIGRYYRTPGFQSLVSQETDLRHQGEALAEFTRIDPAVDFMWTGQPVETCPDDYFSARWYGYLLPKATAAAGLPDT